jgi:hypothetical protein
MDTAAIAERARQLGATDEEAAEIAGYTEDYFIGFLDGINYMMVLFEKAKQSAVQPDKSNERE